MKQITQTFLEGKCPTLPAVVILNQPQNFWFTAPRLQLDDK